MKSPLLDIADLPEFSKINAEQIEPALDEVLNANRSLTNSLLEKNTKYSWDNLIEPLEVADNELERMWSPISHMNGVVNTPEFRDAYNTCLPKLSEYSTEMGQNKVLFSAIQQIQDIFTQYLATVQYEPTEEMMVQLHLATEAFFKRAK